jgi:Carbohydrate binding domain
MPFDFPNTPSAGQRVTGAGGTVYVWDGVKWASNVGNVTAQSMGDIGRNLVHNGRMWLTQRGQGPFTGNGVYTLDRYWQAFITGTMSSISTNLTDADRAALGDEGAQWGFQTTIAGQSGATAYAQHAHNIEWVHTLGGKTVTVSFWAKVNAGTHKLGVGMAQWFGSGGSASAEVFLPGQAVTLTTTWTRFALTFTLPTTSGKVLGTSGDDSTQITFYFSAGANTAAQAGSIGIQSGAFQLWGLQLEIGTVATPLERLDLPRDVANCLRFYSTGQVVAAGYGIPGAPAGQTVTLLCPMRALPTVVLTDQGTSNLSSVNCVAVGSGSQLWVSGAVVATGGWVLNQSYTAAADI